MSHVVREYFVNLFAGETGEVELTNEVGHRLIHDEQNRWLIREFEFEEFMTALKQCILKRLRGQTASTQLSFNVSGLTWGLRCLSIV